MRRATRAVRLLFLPLVVFALIPAAVRAARGGESQPAGTDSRLIAPGELQAALAASRSGDRLTLAAGIHQGPIVVSVPVHLAGTPGAVIEGSGVGPALVLAADGIEVSGVEIRGSGGDLSMDDAAVLLREAHGITLRDSRVRARAFGIYLRAGGGHRIVGNVVEGEAAWAASRRGNGIHLWNSVGNEVVDNHVADVRDGVYLSFAHDNLIRGNEGRRLRYGIHYMYSERNRLIGNRFEANTGGIALMFSKGNRIEGNETVDNRDFGILCQMIERSVLTGNRTRGNGRGFFLENSHGNTISSNVISRNGVGVYVTAGSEDNVFTANRFGGNLVQAYEDRWGWNRWSEAGRGNYWSDYAGFDWNDDGIGELPYQLQTPASSLMARYPVARWFWTSPALTLLDWWDARVSALDERAFDPYPLVDGPATVASR